MLNEKTIARFENMTRKTFSKYMREFQNPKFNGGSIQIFKFMGIREAKAPLNGYIAEYNMNNVRYMFNFFANNKSGKIYNFSSYFPGN